MPAKNKGSIETYAAMLLQDGILASVLSRLTKNCFVQISWSNILIYKENLFPWSLVFACCTAKQLSFLCADAAQA